MSLTHILQMRPRQSGTRAQADAVPSGGWAPTSTARGHRGPAVLTPPSHQRLSRVKLAPAHLPTFGLDKTFINVFILHITISYLHNLLLYLHIHFHYL